MSRSPIIAFLVQRIGPYHHARLMAWAKLGKSVVWVIEFRSDDAVYAAWGGVRDCGEYHRRQTHSKEQLWQALDEIKPEVIVCVGYADLEISQAMWWALRKQVPLVTCSDTTFTDGPRSWGKEQFKRRVVAAFSAALVAGSRAQHYLQGLGLDPQHQFRAWDAVDNCYFEQGAGAARNDTTTLLAQLKLPNRYFLCVARFIPEKNLPRLIEAYASYVGHSGDGAWALVLSGSGPLEEKLRRTIADARLGSVVHFTGFIQYSELPAYYGLAGALVLPSVSETWGLVVNEAMAAGLPVMVSAHCGCAPDLVREGENGFIFEPEDVTALADLMRTVAGLDETRRTAMGRRSREIVAAYSPAAFANGLEAAVTCAFARRHRRIPWLTRLIVCLMAKR